MSQRHYDMCCKNIGRPAKIVTHDGKMHKGVIKRVTPSRVFIEPLGASPGGYAGAIMVLMEDTAGDLD
ncbi:hypothetical protein J416_01789 [Gracilibacillus halophilus YIM-C55.5]|uniref:Uncharacterized protein n=1 Tax=Gracilibacillus halophilus YIM-C55.5 TaxID=1308866 RepID=N4WYR4_9BACI|nr:hypothetical protein J416_01789 [Gracilibacillus halophilus YIM-C55.5]